MKRKIEEKLAQCQKLFLEKKAIVMETMARWFLPFFGGNALNQNGIVQEAVTFPFASLK